MAGVKLAQWPFPAYRGALTEGAWVAGEVREVSEEVAAYLCGTFPGSFVRVGASPAVASVDLSLLDGSSKAVAAGLDGLEVGTLAALRDAEVKGKNRKTVLRALDAALEG
ncbi:MAG: hypothetical protein KAI80_05395 [Hyphomicrobiaceae bacterium]|nr:hypothetical protein [Hyphomicrobiaceae bacterium]MCK5495825.1 hypothetical protein [Hyphomicrobiaceae bacterium]